MQLINYLSVFIATLYVFCSLLLLLQMFNQTVFQESAFTVYLLIVITCMYELWTVIMEKMSY